SGAWIGLHTVRWDSIAVAKRAKWQESARHCGEEASTKKQSSRSQAAAKAQPRLFQDGEETFGRRDRAWVARRQRPLGAHTRGEHVSSHARKRRHVRISERISPLLVCSLFVAGWQWWQLIPCWRCRPGVQPCLLIHLISSPH